jgi:hypothetical protein
MHHRPSGLHSPENQRQQQSLVTSSSSSSSHHLRLQQQSSVTSPHRPHPSHPHNPSHLNNNNHHHLPHSHPLALGYPLSALAWMSSARGKPRRGMMRRAVFSDSQRQGLEKRFQVQKYISKPDRKKLAEELGLKDSQVNKSNQTSSFLSPGLRFRTCYSHANKVNFPMKLSRFSTSAFI